MWTKFVHCEIGKRDNDSRLPESDVIWIELDKNNAVKLLMNNIISSKDYLVSEYNSKPIISNVKEYQFVIPSFPGIEFTATVISQETIKKHYPIFDYPTISI